MHPLLHPKLRAALISQAKILYYYVYTTYYYENSKSVCSVFILYLIFHFIHFILQHATFLSQQYVANGE